MGSLTLPFDGTVTAVAVLTVGHAAAGELTAAAGVAFVTGASLAVGRIRPWLNSTRKSCMYLANISRMSATPSRLMNSLSLTCLPSLMFMFTCDI